MKHANRQTTTRTLADLYRAHDQQRAVTITYTKADDTESVRTIEIWDIRTTAAGHIVIKAMDRQTGESRTFRLDRIRTYTVHRTGYTLRPADDTEATTALPTPRTTAAIVARELGRDYLPTRRPAVALAA